MADPKAALAAIKKKYGVTDTTEKKQEPKQQTTRSAAGSNPKEALAAIKKKYGLTQDASSRYVSGLQSWQDAVSGFSKQVSDDYSKRNGVWQDSTSMNRYRSTTKATARELQNRASSFVEYFKSNRDKYDAETVDDIIASLEETSSWLGELGTSLDSEYDYWSQWETEEDYNNWQRWSALDVEQAEKRLETLKAEQEILPFKYGESPEYLQISEQYENDIRTLEQDIFQAQKLQKAAGYAGLMNAQDFGTYSAQGAAIKNPSYEDATGDFSVSFRGRDLIRLGEDPVGNIVTFSRENADRIRDDRADSQSVVGNYLYGHMSDEEASIYNYLLAKEGPEKAQEYLDFLEEALNAREGGAAAKRIQGIDNGLVRGLGYGAYGFASGFDQAMSGLKQLVSEERLPTSAMQFGNQALLEDLSGFGKVAYQGTNMIGNMAPSILVSAVASPMAGSAVLGAGAAGNAYNQALNEGYSKAQARDYGIAVGASEAALQMLLGGIASLGGVGSEAILGKVAHIDSWLARTFLTGAVKLGAEVTEEELQNFLEPAFRTIIFGEAYDAPTIDEILETAYVTLLSTGVLEGPAIISSASQATNRYGAEVKSKGNEAIMAVIEEGLKAAPGSDSYKLAQKLKQQLESGKTVGDRALGMLAAEQNQQRMKEAVKPYMEAPDGVTDLIEEGKAIGGEAAAIAEKMEKRLKAGRQLDEYDVIQLIQANTQTDAMSASEEAQEAVDPLAQAAAEMVEEQMESTAEAAPEAPSNVMRKSTANQASLESSGYGEHGGAEFQELVDSDTTGRSVEQMRRAFDPFYQAGVAGTEIAKFGSAEQQIAYNAGKKDAIAFQAAAQRVTAAQKGHAKVGIIQSPEAKRITAADAKVYNAFGQALQTPIYVKEHIAALGDAEGAEGETAQSGAITLALDSYTPGDYRVFMHETGLHRLKQLAPEETGRLINAIVATSLKSTGMSGSTSVNAVRGIQNEYTSRGGSLSTDIAMEEVAAETIGKIFASKPERALAILNDVLGELEAEAKREGKTDAQAKAEVKSTVERVIQWVRDTIAKLKAYFSKNKATMDAETQKGFQDAINDLTAAEKLWKDALKASVKKAQELSGITASEAFADASAEAQAERIELSDALTRLSIRKKEPPKKTGIAYKVFVVKDGKLYPPMVANPGGEGTPVGVWLDADAGKIAGYSKEGRPQVEAGGKGTNAAKGKLAYRPGWHLGDIPHATQFAKVDKNNRVQAVDKNGKPKFDKQGKPVWQKTAFPKNFVWAECEYAMDVDYQDEAMSYGYTKSGAFRHSYAGLPKLPTDGCYRYRTNPNPDTVPWVITGAMKVNRILTDAETDAICRENGVEPMPRLGGPIDLEKYGLKAGETASSRYALKGKYDYETLTSKPNMTLTDVDDTVQYVVSKQTRKDIVKEAQKNAAAIGRTNENGGVEVYVDDIGVNVVLATDGLSHGLDRRMQLLAPVTVNAGKILKNSIRINELLPRKDTIANTYALLGAARGKSGDLYIVEFVVNRYDNTVASMDVLYSVNTKKEPAALNAPGLTGNPLSVTDSEISIAQLLDIARDNFPDVLPESVLRHYGFSSRPDGSLGESALYSLKNPSKADADYMDAVARGKKKKAQQMVDAAAVEAGVETGPDGKPIALYHGTPNFGFTTIDTKFSDDSLTFWATAEVSVAESYLRSDFDPKHKEARREIGNPQTASNDAKLDRKKHSEEAIVAAASVLYPEYKKAVHTDEEKLRVTRKDVKRAKKYGKELISSGAFTGENLQTLERFVDAVDAKTLENLAQATKDVTLGFKDLRQEVEWNEKYDDLLETFIDTVSDIEPFTKPGWIDSLGNAINIDKLVQNYNRNEGVYKLYYKAQTPFVLDCKGRAWNKISAPATMQTASSTVTTRDVARWAYERGYDSVKFENTVDMGSKNAKRTPATVWCFMNPKEQLWSADPVTYDDNGNVIPLSQRFDSEKGDIRYSLKNPAEKTAVDALGKGADVIADKQGDLLLATSKDKSTSLYSIKTYKDGGRKKLESMLRQKGHSDAEIADTLSLVDDAADYLMMLASDFAKSHGYKVLADHLQASVVTNVKTGKQAMSVMVSNGDYPVNIDTTLTCKKRDAYMKLMTQLVDDGIFDQVLFGGEAIAEVNKILRKNGFETACLGCFVESRRLQFQAWASTIVREWNAEVDARTDNAESFRFGKDETVLSDEDIYALQKELKGAGKKNAQGNLNLGKGSVREKMGRLLDKVPSLRKHLTTADLLTPKGLAALRAYDPNLFSLVKSRYGAASPKIVQDFTPYASELADLTFAAVKNITFKAVKGAAEYTNRVKREMGGPPTKKAGETKNEFKARKDEFNKRAEEEAMRRYLYDIGGVRIQSFSDFMIENVFDYLQIFADLAAGEFPLHGYSKEAICLRLFGMTGAKWNGSWIAHVDKSLGKEYAGLLPASEAKNGNALLVRVDGKEYAIGMDDYARNKATNGDTFVQSIGMKDMIALMLDPRYSSNVGSITIGVSDKQILAMLDSPLFSMVIPYHASGMLPQFAKLVGVDLYNDYTDYQNTTVKEWFDAYGNKVNGLRNKDGSLVSVDTSYNFNAEFQKTGDAKKAASNYLAWCAKKHPVVVDGERIGYVTFSPKFSNSPYGTDFTKHENYYKLLEDFTSYDSISGAAAVQGAVTMNFPSETNRLTAAQMDAYKAALRATGVFTDKDIEKYSATANKTFKELIAGEVKGRADYKVVQDAKWETTYGEVKDLLRSDFNPDGYVFSLKRNRSAEQENARLREVIAGLQEQFTITKFAKPDKKAVSALASTLAKEYSSQADVSEVADGLTELFDMMNNQVESLVETYGDAWYSTVTKKAEEVAENILRQSVEVESEVYDTYRDLREHLRTTRITLDPADAADLTGYESISQFKRAYKGKIRLVNDGLPVNTAYSELAGDYPGLFSEEEHSTPADQLLHIAKVLDDMAPVEFNPYEKTMSDAVSWLATDIVDRAYNLARAKPTFADKAAAAKDNAVLGEKMAAGREMATTKRKHQEQMAALREEKNARIRSLIAEHRETTRSAVLAERTRQEKRIKKLKDTVSDLEAMVKAYKKADRAAAVDLDSEILRTYQSDPSVFRMAMLQLEPKDRAVVRETYDKLIEEHGAIAPGENPVREVQVPKKTADGRKVSQTVRTVMEAAATPDDALPTIEQMVADGYFSYDVYTDKEAIADAKLEIDRKTLPIAFADWRKDVESGIVSKKHTVLGWALYNYAVNAGETATAMEVLHLMVGHQRNAAQALQATRVLKQLSPEAQMYEAQLTVERINEQLAQREQARIFKKSGKKKRSADANLPVEEWMEKTGELLTKKLADRTKTSEAKAKTTAQIILDDLWRVASKKVKAGERISTRRSNMDVIEDLFNNQAEFQRAWDAAKAHLEEQYGDNPAVLEALDEWKNSALDYRAEFSKEVAGKYEGVQIDPKLIDKFFEQTDQEGRDEVMKDIYRNIGSQLPSTFADKWNAWRYLGMLGNPRTHVRNIIGNAGFLPVVWVKDVTAAGIESAASWVSRGKLNRTKSGKVFSKKDGALWKAAWADFNNVQDLLDGGRAKDNANPNKYIEDGRRIYGRTEQARTKVGKAISATLGKVAEGARKGNSNLLEAEDMWFSRPHYAYAMLQYCKANNITAEQIARGKAIGPARAYAMKEAQKATYRDANAFSNMVSRMGRTGDAKSTLGKMGRGLVEGVLPFRRTPANILVRGLEYSPAGLLKSLAYDWTQVKKFANTNGEQGISGAQMIDNLSAGLTGTGLLALGIWLAAEGLVRGHGDDDEKEKEFEELMGHQAYALELPDGRSITLDWLAPEALPFFVGVNLYEATAGSDKEITMESLLSSSLMITEPMLEMSMLQGLNDMIESVGYNKSNGIVAIVSSAFTSLLGQAQPTLFGQIERSKEPVRMATYTDKNNKWLTPDMQYTLGKLSQKAPGWDFGQIPYIDAWGRKEYTGGRAARIANNLLNPAYTSKVNESAMEKELLRLYDATGENVFPARASKEFTVDKVEKNLTGDEYVKYATQKGQKSYSLVTDLTQSKGYKALTDAEKVDAIEAAYDMADQLAKKSISAFKPDKWVTEAQNSRSLGMTTSEFIVAKVKYGTDNLTTDKATEAVDAGVDIEEYLEFKNALSAANKANGDTNLSKAEWVDALIDQDLDNDDTWTLFLDKYDSKGARYVHDNNISSSTYFEYLETLAEVDQPTESGKYGSYTNDEITAAIKALPGLSDTDRAILWQSSNPDGSNKNNPWRRYLP